MVYLTRKAEFSASHYYHNPEFTPEENRRIFGKCNNPNGHGHNYTLEVTVKGEVDPRSGFVVDGVSTVHSLNVMIGAYVPVRSGRPPRAQSAPGLPTLNNNPGLPGSSPFFSQTPPAQNPSRNWASPPQDPPRRKF